MQLSSNFDRSLSLNQVNSSNPMEQNQLLESIAQKITRLGEVKNALEQTVNHLREENASMHKINKELQTQIDELLDKNNELIKNRSQSSASDEDFRNATRQRINELVKEVEDCITLLNK